LGSAEATTTTGAQAPTATALAYAAQGTLPLAFASEITPGYVMATGQGAVASFGNLPYEGSLAKAPAQPVVAVTMTKDQKGYWLIGAGGAVYPFGDAHPYGSLASQHVSGQRIVSASATPDGQGYWMAAADGYVFTFGDAGYYGSEGNARIPAQVTGMAVTCDGSGYWLVGATGQVYAFGDAEPLGSASGALGSPVTGIAATPDGRGYLLVTAKGKVVAFGDAANLGGAQGTIGQGRVVGIFTAPWGQGYWLLAADGRLFSFGSAKFRGSAQGTMPAGSTAVAMAPGAGSGDNVVSTGSFGPTSPAPKPTPQSAPPAKKSGGGKPKASTHKHQPPSKAKKPVAKEPAPKPVAKKPAQKPVAKKPVAKKPVAKKPKTPAKKVKAQEPPTGQAVFYPSGARGYDVSWPQCGKSLPPHSKVAIVGVNGGWAFTGNPCFGREASWAAANLDIYINLNSPRGSDTAEWRTGPAGKCARANFSCESYNYGYNTALFSVKVARSQGARSKTWWLDVETASYWSGSQKANARVVAGALAALRSRHLHPAVYSTSYQWRVITGGYVPGTSAWYPTGIMTDKPEHWCSATSFAGGPVKLVQSAAGRFDGDYSC
jgi:hypothetical protein